jgi:uncharacterized protein (TIGR00251 family)
MQKEILEIKVVPNAGKTELIKTGSGYKARLAAAPVDGRANEALINLISKEFGVTKRNVAIIRGKTGKNKVVEIRRDG